MADLSTSSDKRSYFGCLMLIVLLLAFQMTFTPVLMLLGQSTGLFTFFISRLFFWLFLALIYIYSLKIEFKPLLIWRDKTYAIGFYIASVFLIFLTLFLGTTLLARILVTLNLFEKSNNLSKILGLLRGHTGMIIFTALTAGVVEELLFRGYLQPRFEKFVKNPYLSILITNIFFGLLHYKYGTISNVVGPFFIGLVFGYYYWKFRNIKVLIFCHFAWDMLSFLSLYLTRK